MFMSEIVCINIHFLASSCLICMTLCLIWIKKEVKDTVDKEALFRVMGKCFELHQVSISN